MADSIITKQELIDAQKDAVTLKDAVNGNETGIVTPRLNEPYSTLPAAIQKIENDGADALNKLESAKEEILTQVNNITNINSTSDLNSIEKWDGRTVYVKNIGNYRYDSSLNNWFLVGNLAQSVISSSGFTQEQINNRKVNIRDYGALPGLNNNAGEQIQDAIDDAILKGIWFVEVPAGDWVSSRTLELA